MDIEKQRKKMREVINNWIADNEQKCKSNIERLQKEANKIDLDDKSELIKATTSYENLNMYLKDLFKYEKIEEHKKYDYQTCVHETSHAYIMWFFEMPSYYCSVVQVNEDMSGFVNWVRKVNPALAIFTYLGGTIGSNIIFEKNNDITASDYEKAVDTIQRLYWINNRYEAEKLLSFYTAIAETIITGGKDIIIAAAKLLELRGNMQYSELIKIFNEEKKI